MAIVTDCELRPNTDMSRSPKDVKLRLQATQDVMKISAADLCRETGIKPNQWSQWLSLDNKRKITLAGAYKLKDKYGITLEWVYDADPTKLPGDLRDALRRKAA